MNIVPVNLCTYTASSSLSVLLFLHFLSSALGKIITTGFKALQLQYFFTAGKDEVKAWTILVSSGGPFTLLVKIIYIFLYFCDHKFHRKMGKACIALSYFERSTLTFRGSLF